jgi:signal peptidase I
VLSSSSRKAVSYKERKAIAAQRLRRAISLVVFFSLYLFFSNSVSTPLKVVSSSMEPLLFEGDRILYSRFLVDTQSRVLINTDSDISRGDLLVISPPYYRKNQRIIEIINPVIRFFSFQKFQLSSYSRYNWETGMMVKRVIALPGDTIRTVDQKVYLKIPGEKYFSPEEEVLKVKYKVNTIQAPEGWKTGYPLDGSIQEYELSDGEYWVLSDNRGSGSDSFFWGPLKEDRIIGKVFFRYWPLSGFSFL